MAQIQVDLKLGDGIVLYTDGITEAENELHEFYLVERLCEVISHHWHRSTFDLNFSR